MSDGDLLATLEMGISQILLETHKNNTSVEEITNILYDISKRLEALENVMLKAELPPLK